MTPGESCAGGRWGAQSPRCPESAQLDDPRRLFEGCAGAWRGRHCQRNPELSLIGIRDDGQAEPSWCRAAMPPPCRPALKPRSALVPAVLNRRPSHGGPRVRIALAPPTQRIEFRRFGAKPDKKIVDRQAASPSSWKTPFI